MSTQITETKKMFYCPTAKKKYPRIDALKPAIYAPTKTATAKKLIIGADKNEGFNAYLRRPSKNPPK